MSPIFRDLPERWHRCTGWIAPLAAVAVVTTAVGGTPAAVRNPTRAVSGASAAQQATVYVAVPGIVSPTSPASAVVPIQAATNKALPPITTGNGPSGIAI